ncbi:MAG: chalcone isomerase family protein [Desulfocapsa sp.]|nr:chalcone isomerase family protein [Desulfocapsa sp.]
MFKNIICLLFLLVSSPALGLEIAGVTIPESLSPALQLNGAGIRSKLFFKIYIAELYLEHPSPLATTILDGPGRKRVVMHFLYDEVKKEKLVESWNDGFTANLSPEQLKKLSSKIQQFNDLFVDIHEGEEIILDYSPDQGTVVSIAGESKGTIEGKDFNRALLSIWLGDKPVTNDLRDALLGKK